MKKRSWGWRLMAIAAGVALALGLVACGGDDDTAADTATAGGGGTTLNLAYVTTASTLRHRARPVRQERVQRPGGADVTTHRATRGRDPAAAGRQSGVVDMATVSAAVWDTARGDPFQALQAPWLITTTTLEGQVIGGPIGKAMLTGTDAIGVLGCWRSTRAGCASRSAPRRS